MFFIKRTKLQESNRNLENKLVIARAEIAMLGQLLDEANNDLHEALKENAALRSELDGLHERI